MTELFPTEESLSPFNQWKKDNRIGCVNTRKPDQWLGEEWCAQQDGDYPILAETEDEACWKLSQRNKIPWFQSVPGRENK